MAAEKFLSIDDSSGRVKENDLPNDNNFPFTGFDCGQFLTERNFSARNSGTIVYTTTAQTVPINLTDAGADTVAFSLSSGELEFNQAGSFYVQAQFSTIITVADGIMLYTIELNTGSGFVAIPGSLIAMDGSLIGGFAAHNVMREVRVDANKGDLLRLRANLFIAGATASALAGGNFLIVRPITPTTDTEWEIDCGVFEGTIDPCDKIRCIDCGVL